MIAHKHSILILLATLLTSSSWAATDVESLNVDPNAVPQILRQIEPSPTPSVFSNNQPPSPSLSDSTLITIPRSSSTSKYAVARPSNTVDGNYWNNPDPQSRAEERERNRKKNQDVMIGGLMILIVGLLGPVVLYCWIRRRRRQEEAEFAAYMGSSPPYTPSSQQSPSSRRHGMEMRNIPVHRPVSPSGVPPPPTYQEAIASGRIPEQPK